MGCGGSKEEKKHAATSGMPVDKDKPQPIRKIRTNFSDVHYDEPASGRRDTVYAPSEVPESRRPTEVREDAVPSAPVAPAVGADGMLSPGTSQPASPAPQDRRWSWYNRFLANRMEVDKSITDEDLEKVIGMSKEKLAQWSKNRPVGPRQESQYAGNAGLMAGGDGG